MQQKLRLIRGRRVRKQSRTSEKTLRNRDRLNHAPDHAETALLLIDVINDLEFEGGDKLYLMRSQWLALWPRLSGGRKPTVFP